MSDFITAVVVTYNRKDLLCKCLTGLLKQTRQLDKILIIDNASTDGTRAQLESDGYLRRDCIEYMRLPYNAGGAGGFATGMRCAIESGSDWVWLMDDDGCPDSDCLRRLLSSDRLNGFHVRAPLVIDVENHDKLSFRLRFGGNVFRDANAIKVAAGSESVIPGCNPFNGVMVDRFAAKVAGFPMRELFIWGDEIEYLLRLNKCGLYSGTLLAATFYHPADRQTSIPVWWGVLGKSLQVSGVRAYCYYRNQTYIRKEYYGALAVVKWVLKNVVQTAALGQIGKTFMVLSAAFDGVFNLWGGEKKWK